MAYNAQTRDRYRAFVAAASGVMVAGTIAATGSCERAGARPGHVDPRPRAGHANCDLDGSSFQPRDVRSDDRRCQGCRDRDQGGNHSRHQGCRRGDDHEGGGGARGYQGCDHNHHHDHYHQDQDERILTVARDQAEWSALGTYVQLTVADATKLSSAEDTARALLDRIDAACSRFRADSDLSRVNAAAGRDVSVSPLLAMAVEVAVQVAGHTQGIVHPLLGDTMVRLGYNTTYSQLDAGRVTDITTAPVDLDAWRDIRVSEGSVRIPAGHSLDLGATGKAWAADIIAQTIVRELGVGVIISVGGDIAVATPEGQVASWPVEITEHPDRPGHTQIVQLGEGGLATSSTQVRRWSVAGITAHHLIDPRTGAPAADVWRTVTASGPSAVAANAATTAAIVLGEEATEWLNARHVAARLVASDGTITTTGGWPTDEGGLNEPDVALVS